MNNIGEAKTSVVPSMSVIDRFCDVLELRIDEVVSISNRIDTITSKLACCAPKQDGDTPGPEATCAIERVDIKLAILASSINNLRKSLCALEEVHLVLHKNPKPSKYVTATPKTRVRLRSTPSHMAH